MGAGLGPSFYLLYICPYICKLKRDRIWWYFLEILPTRRTDPSVTIGVPTLLASPQLKKLDFTPVG